MSEGGRPRPPLPHPGSRGRSPSKEGIRYNSKNHA